MIQSEKEQMPPLLSEIKHQVNEALSRRRAVARRRTLLQGEHISPAPYGYIVVGKKLVPNAMAVHVRSIFDMRDSGFTYKEICEELNARKICSPRGKRWTRQVAYLLKNRVYRGETIYRPWHQEEPIILQTPWTMIVDPEVFDRVQQRKGRAQYGLPDTGYKA